MLTLKKCLYYFYATLSSLYIDTYSVDNNFHSTQNQFTDSTVWAYIKRTIITVEVEGVVITCTLM